MAFKKDYQKLYEATKADLEDQIDLSSALEDELLEIKQQFADYQNNTSLRERVANQYAGSYGLSHCERVLAWITQASPAEPLKVKRAYKRKPTSAIIKIKGGPKDQHGWPVATKKRKYTKKSAHWKKKKK